MIPGSPLRLADVETLDFAKGNGLLPAVVQHAVTGAVLMVGEKIRADLEVKAVARKQAGG